MKKFVGENDLEGQKANNGFTAKLFLMSSSSFTENVAPGKLMIIQ